jgi:putative ABC transport system permease protein
MTSDNETDNTVKLLKKDLDNEYVAPYMTYVSKVYFEEKDDTIQVVVLDARDANEIFNFNLAKDKKTPLKLKNSGAIVSEKFAENHGIKKGDYITFESAEGIKGKVRVAEICEMYFQHFLFVSSDYYSSIFEDKIHYTKIAVKNVSGGSPADDLIGVEGVDSVDDFSDLTDQFNDMIQALNYIILIIIVTAGSLAMVVLINLTQVNISERIREIATLKVLGFRRREVNSYIFKEIFILTLIGALVGLPLGVIEHHFIMGVLDMEMIKFGMVIKPHSYLYAFLITMVFSGIVLMFTSRNLRKVEMVESLKSVE